jgi:hypothetical protein
MDSRQKSRKRDAKNAHSGMTKRKIWGNDRNGFPTKVPQAGCKKRTFGNDKKKNMGE